MGRFFFLVFLLTLLLPAWDGHVVAREAAPTPTLLADKDFAPALRDGIRQARRSIVCGYFLFKVTKARNNEPLRIVDELIRARRRGVDVTVILERDKRVRDKLNEQNEQTAALLSRGGVRVRFDSPQTVTHLKTTVIDNRYVYLGSHNLTQSALKHNNELSLLIDSTDLAAEILRYLDRL